jgi:murein DD-endopeptidase MepM/ murein hydrolase activator NlpD
MTAHILPVPSWCVETQSFAEHEARARAMGCCPKPAANCSCYYYGGLDLAPPWARANEDIPIKASASGVCTIKDESPKGYGLSIRQTTPDGELIIYGHLSRTTVGSREIVSQGNTIGWMGSTGNSTGKHIHWEIRVNGIPVDPRTKMGAPEPEPQPEPPVFELPDIQPHPLVRVTKAIGSYLNVRMKPVNGIIVGKLYANDVVPCIGLVQKKQDYWYAVILPDDTMGWAAAFYKGEVWLEVVK